MDIPWTNRSQGCPGQFSPGRKTAGPRQRWARKPKSDAGHAGFTTPIPQVYRWHMHPNIYIYDIYDICICIDIYHGCKCILPTNHTPLTAQSHKDLLLGTSLGQHPWLNAIHESKLVTQTDFSFDQLDKTHHYWPGGLCQHHRQHIHTLRDIQPILRSEFPMFF